MCRKALSRLTPNKSAFALFGSVHNDIGIDLIDMISDCEINGKISRHLHENYSFTYQYEDKVLYFVLTRVTDPAISDNIESILIVTDITAEKLIAKQKSDFFANASHELKTPITVMQGFSEMLMNKEGMDEVSKKQLGRIHKESLRLGSLISDMLMLSMIEGGEAPKRTLSKVSLDEISKDILEGLTERIKAKNLTVSVEGSASLISDYNMMVELVENLISNAVKYNKDDGSVTVVLQECEQGVLLQVKDTGIGIEKTHLPRLCERFYRVDKSHSKRIGGTGLGLAIVKHICAILDAKLSIESEFGIGTTVSVMFGKQK